MKTLKTMTKNNILISVLFFLVGGFVFGQTTTYTENFTTTSLNATFTTTTFTTNMGTWSAGGGGCGLVTGANSINGNTMKLKPSVVSSATTPAAFPLRGVSTISFSAKTSSTVATSVTLTDGNATFSSATTVPVGTAITSSGTISVPNTSNGIFTFSYPNTANGNSYLDDIMFTFKKPTTQVTGATSTISSVSNAISWTRPNTGNDNQGCIVFVGPDSNAFIPPTDGVSYTASTTFGTGTQIGTSGYFCVYNGTGTSVASIASLTAGTNYSVYVLEYNGIKGQSDENYLCTVLNATPTSLSNFTTVPSVASVSQSFSVSGTGITTGNVTVTPPVGYEINNPAVNSTYSTGAITLTPTSGTLVSTTINIRLITGLTAGTIYNGNVTVAATNATTQTVALSGACYINYYYNGSGALNLTTSWGTNTNGSGSNPLDFGSATSAQAFYLVNTTAVSTSATWTIGSNSLSTANRLIIGNGSSPAITLTITSGNWIKFGTNSKFNVLAPSSGNNEIIFQDSSIPTVNSPDITTNLTYAVNGGNVGVSGSTYNQLKITNNCAVSLTTTPVVKYLIIDSGSSLIAPASNYITLSTGGNAVINGSITSARSQGVFTTDPTSTTKGTVFSTDTSATMTLGCSSTVIYNRGGGNISTSTQILSPLNYANLIISPDAVPSFTTVKMTGGTTRINGLLSFTGTGNYFIVNTGTLVFGLNASINITGGTIDLGSGLPAVVFETNSTLISGVNLTGVVNLVNPTYSNVVGTASADSVVCKGSSATINLASSTGSIQWQSSSALGGPFSNVSFGTGATTVSYATASLSATTYFRANVTNSTCSSGYSNIITKTINNNIWTSSWSVNNPPLATDSIEFQGSYTSLGDITACSCTVANGAVVTISSGNTLKLTDGLIVNSGSITFNDTASLLQTNTITNTSYAPTITPTFIRKTAPIRKFDYTYWSSPIATQSLINLSPNTASDKFYSFDSTLNNWLNESSSNTMVLGKGYIIRGPNNFDPVATSVYTASFNGIPNNGNISIPINGTSGTFNLIGNPYPSSIDAELLYEDNNLLINPNFYFWSHNTPFTGYIYSSNDYAIYNAVIGAGIGTSQYALSAGGGNTNPADLYRYIASEQGFFVQGLGTGNLFFKNTQRVAGSNNVFFKNTLPNAASNSILSDKIWLNLSGSLGLFKQQLICYVPGASNEYDSLYDAKSLNANSFIDFYSLTSQSDKCAIQSRVAPFNNQDSVSLGYSASTACNLSISIDHFDGDFNNQDIYLADNYLGVYTNLKQEPYNFSTATGTFDSRFTLQYTTPSLMVPQHEKNTDVLVYSKDNKVFIDALHDTIVSIEIFDVLGRTIILDENLNTSSKIYEVSNSNTILLVSIKLSSGIKVVKKVLL